VGPIVVGRDAALRRPPVLITSATATARSAQRADPTASGGAVPWTDASARELDIAGAGSHPRDMPQVAQFVQHNAGAMTPAVMEKLLRQIPMLKAEFAQMNPGCCPHLVDQLEFFANLLEDFVEGADKQVPLVVAAKVAFALIHVHRRVDLVPDFVSHFGYLDDSLVVRSILIEHEKPLADYADRHGVKWSKITTAP
jgi:uncharacterized membrane protein YkvA (DUF1232 family)